MRKKRKLILASGSKWRKELLKRASIEFDVELSGHEEDLTQKLPPKELVMKLALEKAEAVALRHSGPVVLGADSVVVFRGKVLGKPQNAVEARRVLAQLSGKQHSLITGFAIIDSKSGRALARAEETKVWFRKLSKREIDKYVRTKEPMTVAGGYAIQSGGSSFASKISGDFYNIVGLPLAEVVEELRRCGISA